MDVCCECCVLSGRGLCDALITRPEKSYRLWCVVVCDLETSRMRRPWPALGRSATGGFTVKVRLDDEVVGLIELDKTHKNIGLLGAVFRVMSYSL